jgi:large subunit ribosomal protein L4
MATLKSASNTSQLTESPNLQGFASIKAGFNKVFDLRDKLIPSQVPSHIAQPSALTTLYSFPTLEPIEFVHYPSTHLLLPLRRDLLHRAVVYEGDKHRQGTASTKWRSEVHGSGKKIRPQKGTGKARLGDKKSPMLRGGGVAFGPKPRDFSTDLNKKIYDLAWRTALSYRYRRGELVVVDRVAVSDKQVQKAFVGYKKNVRKIVPHYVRHVFDALGWGNANKRSFVVTLQPSENVEMALKERGEVGRLRTVDEVDVKNLLEMGRLVVEKEALDYMLYEHQSDLMRPAKMITGSLPASSSITTETSKRVQAILNEDTSLEEIEEALVIEEELEDAGELEGDGSVERLELAEEQSTKNRQRV